MRVGFTGIRLGMTTAQREAFGRLIRELQPVEFHHGDCVGADAQAHGIVRVVGNDVRIIGHPPTDPKLRAYCSFNVSRRAAPYLRRNEAIVDETDVLLACPGESTEMLRSGTWATVRYARRKGKPIRIVYPDGSIEGSTG